MRNNKYDYEKQRNWNFDILAWLIVRSRYFALLDLATIDYLNLLYKLENSESGLNMLFSWDFVFV